MTSDGWLLVGLIVAFLLTVLYYTNQENEHCSQRPTGSTGDVKRRARESAAKDEKLVASLGQLYGDIFTAVDIEKRVDFLVKYLGVMLQLRRSGHPDMKPPAFLTYDQARVKLIEGLNERYEELVAATPDNVEFFDKLRQWLDEMSQHYNRFELAKVARATA